MKQLIALVSVIVVIMGMVTVMVYKGRYGNDSSTLNGRWQLTEGVCVPDAILITPTEFQSRHISGPYELTGNTIVVLPGLYGCKFQLRGDTLKLVSAQCHGTYKRVTITDQGESP